MSRRYYTTTESALGSTRISQEAVHAAWIDAVECQIMADSFAATLAEIPGR